MGFSLLLMFFYFLVPVGIIVLIIALATKRNDGKSENFPKTFRLIYLYTVTIVSLLLTIGGAIFTVTNALNIALPEEPHWITSVEQRQQEQQNQRNRALANLYTSLASMTIGAGVFIYHGKLVKKE
jgi:uncharacterized membrane protein